MAPLIEPAELAALIGALTLHYGRSLLSSRLFMPDLPQPEINLQRFADDRGPAPLSSLCLFFHHRPDFWRQRYGQIALAHRNDPFAVTISHCARPGGQFDH